MFDELDGLSHEMSDEPTVYSWYHQGMSHFVPEDVYEENPVWEVDDLIREDGEDEWAGKEKD
jgi:hypothetical protein